MDDIEYVKMIEEQYLTDKKLAHRDQVARSRGNLGEAYKEYERKYNKEYGKANRSTIVSRNKRIRRQRKMDAVVYKGGKCVDCKGEFHPAAFDFHHLDPATKDVGVKQLLTYTPERLYKELDKCVLLCSNCHRIRHHAEEDMNEHIDTTANKD